MLCNPFPPFSSVGGITVSVFARLFRCFCPSCLWNCFLSTTRTGIHPRSYQSSTSLNHTLPHLLTHWNWEVLFVFFSVSSMCINSSIVDVGQWNEAMSVHWWRDATALHRVLDLNRAPYLTNSKCFFFFPQRLKTRSPHFTPACTC